MCAAHHAAVLGRIVFKTLPLALLTSQSGWDNFCIYEKLKVVRSINTWQNMIVSGKHEVEMSYMMGIKS